MLSTNVTKRQKTQDQHQFSVGDRSSHEQQYPFLREFSRLISKVSIKILEKELLSNRQKEFAKIIWDANNYGGSREKCKKQLVNKYGEKWEDITTIDENMEDIKKYYELVLIIDHKKQWDKHEKSANITIDKSLE